MSGTAELHPDATLTPSKRDLLVAWLPSQPWFHGDAGSIVIVGNFRFVDPYGEVGIETHLVRAGDATYQVPLTYRSEPLEEAAEGLVGTMEHSVLGTRWTYDATSDPVYLAELVRVIREGDTEADRSSGDKTAWVEGSGVVPGVDVQGQVRIAREIGHDEHFTPEHARGILTGTWNDGCDPRSAVLAFLK